MFAIIERIWKSLFKSSEIEKQFSSSEYWDQRYRRGGTSGAGSVGRLAKFKAELLNEFVNTNKITSVIEFGCGDGDQLELSKYPFYMGLDISPTAISICKQRYSGDRTKQFCLYQPSTWGSGDSPYSTDLAISLDVIYHLIEDDVFAAYMTHLFSVSNRYVIVYSSNTEESGPAKHVRHRKFTDFVQRYLTEWHLQNHIKNNFQYDGTDEISSSVSDFYIFKRNKC